MLNTIQAEWMKYKRGKLLLFFIITIIVYICCILAVLPSPGQVERVSYLELFSDAFSFAILTHIMVLGLLATTIFSNEYKNNTIRQLFTIPVSAKQFLLAKFIVVITFSILLMLGFSISVTIIGLIAHSMEMTVSNIGWVFVISLVDAVTVSIALTPIFLLMIISKQNFILSILVVFIYTLIVLVPSMGMITINNDLMAYIFPLGSMGIIHNTLACHAFSSVLSMTMPSANWLLCAVCLCLFAIVFSFLSIVALIKQEH